MSITNSAEIIKSIMTSLFSAEDRRLTATVDRLVVSNREFFPNKPHDGFIFQGKPYDPSNLATGKRTRVTLSQHMNEQMEDFLRDKSQVDNDRKLISQILFPLIVPCSSQQELRDVLPNCVVETLQQLKGITRDQAMAFTLVENPRLHRQFMKILPRIEFYATTRLLY